MAFDRRETALLLLGDFLILVASLWAALFLRNFAPPPFGYFEENLIPFVPVFLLSLVIFYVAGLYEKQTRPIRSIMGIRIFGAQAATVAIAAILFFALPLAIAPKTILILYLVISVVAESLWRFYRMSREIREGNRSPALLIGSGPAVSELCDEVNGNDRYLIRFVSCTDTSNLSKGGVFDATVSGMNAGARIVVVDVSDPAIVREMPALYDLMTKGITFLEFASLYEEIFDRVPLDHLDAGTLLEFLPKHHTFYDTMKRAFDVVLALLVSVIAVPFIVLAALALTLEGGTPFIRPKRIGKGGKTIRLLKLRTMLFDDNADPELQKKNRVTALGRLLRKSRVDELPQLWNVITGDLSFIGPRPEFPKIAEVYEREVPQYQMRHLITPGLSGWAQIHDYDAPRGPADVARTIRKVSYDLYYLKHRSFGLDLAIAVKTIRALASFSGT
ncbi:MAG: sugar transferase [Patescibacteria group bacterium]|nr:sugar transferase [Patescibacteria group bacterium]